MSQLYVKTARVGLLRACLRYVEDPQRNIVLRGILALSPLLLLWVLSPFDALPEIVLGPLGLADDTAILVTLFLLMRFAVSFYSEKRYARPTKDKNGNDIIDI